MSVTIERKTLSISKSKPGMWPAPSNIELIEQDLRTTVMQTLKDFSVKHHPAIAYDDSFRLQRETSQILVSGLSKAFTDLKNALKYPAQLNKMFDTVVRNVSTSLITELGMDKAAYFDKAIKEYTNPKSALPKIPQSEDRVDSRLRRPCR